MEPSQNRDSVSLICLVTRQRYKFPQHLCCLRSWRGKGKPRPEVRVTPSSLSPAQQGCALERIEETEGTQLCSGGSRLPAKHQPGNGAAELRQPQGFHGDVFNSLCATRAPFLMACTKANPALTCNLPGPAACPCSPAVTTFQLGGEKW